MNATVLCAVRSCRACLGAAGLHFPDVRLLPDRSQLRQHSKPASRIATVMLLLLLGIGAGNPARGATSKQLSLDQWRSLTARGAEPPQVFVRGSRVRFYFQTETNVVEFLGSWSSHRVPTEGYKVNSVLLRRGQVSVARPERRGWREAIVIAGAEWRRLSTNLLESLTPQTPGHGAFYQAFFADRVLYRDEAGAARFAVEGQQPAQITIDHRYPLEETLEVLSGCIEQFLDRGHPTNTLFVIMAPNASRFTQPLLLDRQQRQCVWLSPAALYDTTERGLGIANSAQGLASLLFESHGLALVKNPISSAARLADLGIQTATRFLHLPLPKFSRAVPPLADGQGMDLVEWEKWVDRYTGTRQEEGSLSLLIDGDRFFSRLQQAIAQATNHVHINVNIFDRDDVAVSIADLLRRRSAEVKVDVILDQMNSLAAGMIPPSSPMPEDFVMPSSITSYLRDGSQVHVRPFLNPWLSGDHSKIYMVDGTHAWIGGMNLGREYRYEWHDLMFELHGPVVASLENEFRRAWAHEGLLGDFAYAATLLGPSTKPVPTPESEPWIQLRRLPTRTGWKPFNAAVHGALRRAKGYVYVENPYLFDKGVIADLADARARGVDVRVVLPRVNDFKAGARGNLVTANYLRQRGVRVYFYPGMTHVKALLADDWACLGSGNLNHLSLHLCQEQNIATSDSAFAARLKDDLFKEDFDRSYELNQPISVDWVDVLADTVLEGF